MVIALNKGSALRHQLLKACSSLNFLLMFQVGNCHTQIKNKKKRTSLLSIFMSELVVGCVLFCPPWKWHFPFKILTVRVYVSFLPQTELNHIKS